MHQAADCTWAEGSHQASPPGFCAAFLKMRCSDPSVPRDRTKGRTNEHSVPNHVTRSNDPFSYERIAAIRLGESARISTEVAMKVNEALGAAPCPTDVSSNNLRKLPKLLSRCRSGVFRWVRKLGEASCWTFLDPQRTSGEANYKKVMVGTTRFELIGFGADLPNELMDTPSLGRGRGGRVGRRCTHDGGSS